MANIDTTVDMVREVYAKSRQNLDVVRKRLNRSLTLTEKTLYGHLDDPKNQDLTRGESFLNLRPDRVAMQDATAQMALLQFMLAGRTESAVPATVHCDHLIRAHKGEEDDMDVAHSENSEVFDFLASVSSRYHIGFWRPGAGIIHQVILENYAFPGGMMIGTDSHTPNAGGLGMIASGVGGADASDVMAGLPWEVKNPNIVGVHLKGEMKGWTTPKDVILYLLGILTVKGGTNKIIEYFGEGCQSISCTGKGTITNMGAELGATCSLFPYDSRMETYLNVTRRGGLSGVANENRDLLMADEEVLSSPRDFYDEIIEIDLSTLQPHIVGPHSPDLARPLDKMGEDARANGWETELSAALIGSCTNSSYEDIGLAAYVAKEALAAGIKMPQQFIVSPGSSQIKKTIERDGQLEIFNEVGATVVSNACGPCIGQWRRDNKKKGDKNTIINSFNRNFRGRADANPETLSFIASPSIVMALGLAGRLDFNPMSETLKGANGAEVKLSVPKAPELPADGFVHDPEAYQAPKGNQTEVTVAEESERLQLLTPFEAWDGKDMESLLLLCKARGKCTTDHISPAGPWLRYRGHLDNISNNMLLGAVSDFGYSPGRARNLLTGEEGIEYAQIARSYKAEGRKWIIVGDENYGEGSSREHAAMCPRHLGAVAVVTKSFARIHETNLKKQGVLALNFADAADYEKVREDDAIAIRGLESFTPGQPLVLELTHSDGSVDNVSVTHTFNSEQIEWFKAGSALNLLRKS
ncbi:aconitate hydratase [Bdellovibrionales bacterium]|nr:aconitate hydratase [Bdellovibrionales bacterium]